jgi:redox-sensitive bicupin YhaK (pirin superfamily)
MPLSPTASLARIASKTSELAEGLTIRRSLPTRQRRTIGAWCFLDHIGPIRFAPGHEMHVGAHPHTGLQTFTWMIEGEILHRDSLGTEQVIRPGEVNLMTAGHGISHTEDSLSSGQSLHAAQLWVALPRDRAHCAPAFDHYPDLPVWSEVGCTFTLLAGRHAGRTAPTQLYSPLLGLDIAAPASTAVTVDLPLDPAFEHGLLALQGDVSLVEYGEIFSADELAYLSPGPSQLSLTLAPGARVLLLGGAPFEEDIVMWWNFVDSDKVQIEESRRQWEERDARFGTVAGGELRRVPAPPLPWGGTGTAPRSL